MPVGTSKPESLNGEEARATSPRFFAVWVLSVYTLMAARDESCVLEFGGED